MILRCKACAVAAIGCAGFLIAFSYLAAAEAESPKNKPFVKNEDVMYERLNEFVNRARRDKAKAEMLRDETLSQMRETESIIEAARRSEGGVAANNAAIDLGEDMLANARQTVAKAEEQIKQADRRLDQSALALSYLRTSDNKKPYEGLTMPFWRVGTVMITHAGNDEKVPLDFAHDVLIPGDKVETGQDGKMGVASVLSRAHHLTLGPKTRVTLAKDDAGGSEWKLDEGVMHIAPMKKTTDMTNPRIVAPDATIECDEGSEFDVHVDSYGRSHVSMYNDGKIRIIGNKDYPVYAATHDLEITPEPQWWLETMKDPQDNKKEAQ